MKSRSQVINIILDFFPLLVFFICFKKADIFANFWIFKNKEPIIFASFALAIATALSVVIAKILKVKINKFNLFSSVIVIVFAGLTVFFNNPYFIKIKLTIVNLVFAFFIYLYCLITKKSLISKIFNEKVKMQNEKWLVLDKRFFYFFLLIALLNEIVWRGFSTKIWIIYKVFCALPLMLMFIMLQIPFLYKYSDIKKGVK
jgi:intracellular septation protein